MRAVCLFVCLKKGEWEKKHLELYLALTQHVSAVITTSTCGHSASSRPALSNTSFCDDGNTLSSALQQAGWQEPRVTAEHLKCG